MSKKYIFICEHGWRRIREEAISLAKQGVSSTVIIEGLPEKPVRQMITKYRLIKNIFIPERVFTPFAFSYIVLASLLSGRRRLGIFLNKRKTYQRLTILSRLCRYIELTELYD